MQMHRLLFSLSLICKVLVQAIGLTLLDTMTQLSRNMAYVLYCHFHHTHGVLVMNIAILFIQTKHYSLNGLPDSLTRSNITVSC